MLGVVQEGKVDPNGKHISRVPAETYNGIHKGKSDRRKKEGWGRVSGSESE